MSKKLEGKTALITGASKGLGKAMALALAAEGARVVLVSRNRSQLEEVAAAIRLLKAEAEVFPGDLTREEDVLGIEMEVAQRVGPIQILINNAGMNLRKAITDFTLAEWRQVIDANLTSAFLMCRSFVPHMRGRGYGRILNLTSIMSHVSLPHRSAYSASKSGLLGFTRALALELVSEGITVNGISPGPIATEINAPILQDPAASAAFVARIPAGRWGRVEEVGHLAVYLCSEEAGFITGTDILIDGGWTAQ